MLRNPAWVVALAALAAGPVGAAHAQYKIKQVKAPAPKELKESIAKLLSDEAVQLLDANDAVLAEVWFRKEIPAKATAEQVKNGLTYREVPETTLVGAIRLVEAQTDYRKSKLKAGVYTLRLAFQPQDGDHMGTAPHGEFLLLVAVAKTGRYAVVAWAGAGLFG